jgi:hypothetical protein
MLRKYNNTPARERQRNLWHAKGLLSCVSANLSFLLNNKYLSQRLKSNIKTALLETQFAARNFNKEVGWEVEKVSPFKEMDDITLRIWNINPLKGVEE